MPLVDDKKEDAPLTRARTAVASAFGFGDSESAPRKSISGGGESADGGKSSDAPTDDQDGNPVKSPQQVAKEEAEKKALDEAMAKQKLAAKLRKGDYVVQVHVIEGRDLKGRDWGGISDPVCVVTCMKQRKATRIFKKMTNCVWDEVITFEYKNLDVVEVEQAQLTISVFDANVISRDEMIGCYDFDLASIYAQKNHEVFRSWLALSDVTDENEGVQGYLQVTAVVLGPDDEQCTHPPSDYDDAGSSAMSVLLPPHIQAETKMLRVSVYDVRDMPRMDEGFVGGYCDPYAKVEFAGITCKTKHMSGKDVDLNQVMCVPVMEPILASKIKFSMYDWDATSSDDRINTFTLDYAEIKAKPFQARWVHLYGAPEDFQNGWASKMNRSVIPGSFYRGRVLLGASVDTIKDPKMTVDDCSLNPVHRPKMIKYIIQCDLYEGSEMPDKDCWIEVACMKQSVQSSKAKPKDGISMWYEELQAATGGDLAVEMPADLEQCADVFVYLCTKEGRVSFRRYSAEYLLNEHGGWRVPPKWHSMNECLALDAFGEAQFPGTLLFSLRMGPAATAPAQPFAESRPLKDNGVLATPTPAPAPVAGAGAAAAAASSASGPAAAAVAPVAAPVAAPAAPVVLPTVGKLTISILSAKNLPGLDDTGLSDPQVKVVVGAIEKLTQVKEKTLSPVWNESFSYDNHHIDTPIMIKCYDWNKIMKNTKMGEFSVQLRAVSDQDPGADFVVTDDYNIGDQYPTATLTLRLRMEYYGRAQQPSASAPPAPASALSFLSSSSANVVPAASAEAAGSKIADRKSMSNVVSAESRHNRVLGRPNRKQYQLRVHIYQARSLPGLDDSGLSDPYLAISCGGKRVVTSTVEQTVFPTWYTTYCLNVSLPFPLEFASPAMIRAFDYDSIGRDDVMGHVTIPMLTIRAETGDGTRPLAPRWFRLRDNNYQETQGEILAAFQLMDVKVASATPVPNLRPTTRPYFLEVVTLGCRDLNSTVKLFKPQVDFECPTNENSTTRFSTLPSNVPSSENPNFLQVIKIPIDLPLNPLFAPVVAITVRDYLLGGLVKRLVGVSSLDIGKMLVDADGDGVWDAGAALTVSSDADVTERVADLRRRREEKAALERERKEAEAALKREADAAARLVRSASISSVKISDVAIAVDAGGAAAATSATAATAATAAGAAATAGTSVAIDIKSGKDEAAATAAPEFPRARSESASASAGKKDDGTLQDASQAAGGSSASSAGDDIPLLPLNGSDSNASSAAAAAAATAAKPDSELTDAEREALKAKALADEEAKRQDEMRAMDEMFDCTKLDVDAPLVKYTPEVPEWMVERELVDDELEDAMNLSPFQVIPLHTGDDKAALASMRKRRVGSLKGLVRLMDDKTTESSLDLAALLRPREVFVRVYVLQGHRLNPKDSDGTSDPYLVAKLGDVEFSTRDRYHKSTLDPDFYETFEFSTTIPGHSQLSVECWDWDGIGDDLIGTTTIDLEDRWFTKEWRALERKPVELRTLRAPTSSAAQGKLSVFVEILTVEEAKRQPVWRIKPPPPEQFELRVIVWGCKGVPIKDTLTQKTDLYITGSVDESGSAVAPAMQTTDTHLRARNGVGNFNWRFKFPISLPCKPGKHPRLRLQVWDMDFFSANESLCETYLSLRGMCDTALATKGRVKLMKKDADSTLGLLSDKITFDKLTHPNEPEVEGSMQVSIELLPLVAAQALPAGFGREAPNTNPHLAEPPGRIDWSLWHPLDMCYEILGDNICKKIGLLVFLSALASLLYFLAPMIVSQIVANKVTGT